MAAMADERYEQRIEGAEGDWAYMTPGWQNTITSLMLTTCKDAEQGEEFFDIMYTMMSVHFRNPGDPKDIWANKDDYGYEDATFQLASESASKHKENKKNWYKTKYHTDENFRRKERTRCKANYHKRKQTRKLSNMKI